MARLVKITGERYGVEMSRNEALTILATLNNSPTYANKEVRESLKELIDKVPA